MTIYLFFASNNKVVLLKYILEPVFVCFVLTERVEPLLFLLMQVSVTRLQCRTWILLPPLAFGCGPPSLTLLTDRCEPLWGPPLPTTQFQMELRGRGRGGNQGRDETLPDVEPPPDSRWPTERAPADGGSLLRPRVEPAALQAAGLSEGGGESGRRGEQGRVKKKYSAQADSQVPSGVTDVSVAWHRCSHGEQVSIFGLSCITLLTLGNAHTNTYTLDGSRLTE